MRACGLAALCVLTLVGGSPGIAFSQPRRIIDVHLHTIPADWSAGAAPINPVTKKPSTASTGAELLPETLAAMDAYNVVLGLLSGPLESVREWQRSAPERFVGAPQFPMTHTSSLDLRHYIPDIREVREGVEKGQIGAIGEITAQYAGMVPGDATLAPYLALAEEFDLPVGIHASSGTVVILRPEDRPRFRVEYGNPKWVNDVLARHPRLRVYLMHAGYPFFDDTVALMSVYPQLYADLSRVNWSVPREAFHDYLHRLIKAGMGKRLMFGSDGVGLPEAIGLAVEGIESASFLTDEQKDDIFFNNAVRFLELDEVRPPGSN